MFSVEELDEIVRKAKLGDECARSTMYNYGLMLRRGIPKNLKKAIEVWRKAAEFDIPEAAANLAELYENGSHDTGDNRLAPDSKKASDYYNRAADILEKMLKDHKFFDEKEEETRKDITRYRAQAETLLSKQN